MTAMRKIWATRVNNATAATYVGKTGTIFFDELTGALRISDGTTVGGQPLTLVASDFSFQFGDFIATTNTATNTAILSSIHPDENIAINSNGTGQINLTGQFNLFDAQGAFGNEPIFRVKSDGQIRMLVPLADATTGALEVVGNTSGVSFPPNQTGVILHVTGNTGLVARNYFDAVNNYGLLAGRRYNNTQTNPRRVLNNEVMFRLVGQGANAVDNATSATFGTYGPARISFIANEDQTPTAQGGRIQFEITKNGTVADASGTNTITVVSMDAQTGLTATKLNGPLTGNVSATAVTATNITVANTVTSAFLSGKLIRSVRDAGTIGDGGTLTIDLTADSIVHCVWANGMTLAYQNFLPGRVVKIMARKATGSGTDLLSLDGVTGAQTSNGGTSVTAAADTTVFIECISTTNSIAGLYIKL